MRLILCIAMLLISCGKKSEDSETKAPQVAKPLGQPGAVRYVEVLPSCSEADYSEIVWFQDDTYICKEPGIWNKEEVPYWEDGECKRNCPENQTPRDLSLGAGLGLSCI